MYLGIPKQVFNFQYTVFDTDLLGKQYSTLLNFHLAKFKNLKYIHFNADSIRIDFLKYNIYPSDG